MFMMYIMLFRLGTSLKPSETATIVARLTEHFNPTLAQDSINMSMVSIKTNSELCEDDQNFVKLPIIKKTIEDVAI